MSLLNSLVTAGIVGKGSTRKHEVVKYEGHKSYGRVFRVPQQYAKLILKCKKPKIKELSNVKAGLIFTTRALEELADREKTLAREYAHLQLSVAQQAIVIAASCVISALLLR